MVSVSEGESLAREYSMPFMEASALTGNNVDEAFLKLATDVKKRLTDDEDDEQEDRQAHSKHTSERNNKDNKDNNNNSGAKNSSKTTVLSSQDKDKHKKKSWC